MVAQLKRFGMLLLLGALGGAFSVGFKYLISKDVGGACSEPNYCRGAFCVGATRYSTAKDGYCSKACAPDQDCPSGFWCGELMVEQMGHTPRPMHVCLRR